MTARATLPASAALSVACCASIAVAHGQEEETHLIAFVWRAGLALAAGTVIVLLPLIWLIVLVGHGDGGFDPWANLATVWDNSFGVQTVPLALAHFIGTIDTQYALVAMGALLAITPILALYGALYGTVVVGRCRVFTEPTQGAIGSRETR